MRLKDEVHRKGERHNRGAPRSESALLMLTGGKHTTKNACGGCREWSEWLWSIADAGALAGMGQFSLRSKFSSPKANIAEKAPRRVLFLAHRKGREPERCQWQIKRGRSVYRGRQMARRTVAVDRCRAPQTDSFSFSPTTVGENEGSARSLYQGMIATGNHKDL